ncbi:MAG: TonB-dependent receptor [Bacteroidales bacterium]|nr:TonB-dependent receptor [Bacteroidales bacterium]
MTSFIITTICALALNAASLPAQADTTDIYLIDNVRVENFNGSQLAGKIVYSYVIRRENVGDTPVRVHFITTGSVQGGEVAASAQAKAPTVVMFDQDFSNGTVVAVGDKDQPLIKVRTTDPSMSPDDIVYIVDGRQITTDEFKKIDPKNIKSVEVMKGDSAAKYLQGLKDQGKYPGDINPKGAVIVVTQKK